MDGGHFTPLGRLLRSHNGLRVILGMAIANKDAKPSGSEPFIRGESTSSIGAYKSMGPAFIEGFSKAIIKVVDRGGPKDDFVAYVQKLHSPSDEFRVLWDDSTVEGARGERPFLRLIEDFVEGSPTALPSGASPDDVPQYWQIGV